MSKQTISDDYILLGFVFLIMGLLSLVVIDWNIPFFFVIGIIYFTFGLGIWQVPDFGKLRRDAKKVTKVSIKRIIADKPVIRSQPPKDDDMECEEDAEL